MTDVPSRPFSTFYLEPSRNGLTRPKRVRGAGCKMVNMGEIFAHGRLRDVQMDRVPLQERDLSSVLQPGDLLFARQSLVLSGAGKCSIFLGDVEPVCFESHIIRVRLDQVKADPLFFYYLFQSPRGRSAIISIVEQGAGASGIRGSDLARLDLPAPALGIQKAVGALLGSLDDKIELNQRMNETLDAMAQAIFRDWFVDFGPVRRKMAGATDPVAIMGGLTPDPARAAELAALFPDALGDDDLPVGWSERPIGELVDIAGGSTPSTADENLWQPAEHRWATPKDLSNMSDLALFETGRRISSAGLTKITSGLLPIGTVLLSSRAPIGYLAIAQAPVAINQGFIALKPTKDFGSAYLYLWCKANMEAILANANGSTFQEISKKNFRPITSALPGECSVCRAFDEIAEPMFARIVSAASENRTLAETRDYLLPRLMSGEVRVGDAALEIAV